MGAQNRLGFGCPGGFERGALVGHPAVELASADRPAPQLGRHVDRLLVAHLGHQPEPALADPEGVLDARLEAQRGVERDDLAAAVDAPEAPAAQLDLAGEGDQASWRPAVGDQPPSAGWTVRRPRDGRLEPPDQLHPQRSPDLSERIAHGPFKRADIGLLGRDPHGQRHRTLHPEPLLLLAF